MTKLIIIIVSYNTRTETLACLRSLHSPQPTVSHNVIVVDNGSTDGSPDAIRSQWPNVRLIELRENLGYARANNLAVRATTSEVILFLNSDTVVFPDSIDKLIRELNNRPNVTIIGPRLIDHNGYPELSIGSMIGPFNEALQKLKTLVLSRQTPLLAHWVNRTLSHQHYPDWVSGACLLIRRSVAEAAGLLDERFFLYGEDVDFCATVRQLGGKVCFLPEIKVLHHRGRSSTTNPKQKQEARRRSQLAFYEKHHPAWLPILRLYLRIKRQLPSTEKT